MGDELLNGRPATDWEQAAVERARRCERTRDLELLDGLLAVFPRDEVPVPRPVTDLGLLP